jgi:hypothetical protein
MNKIEDPYVTRTWRNNKHTKTVVMSIPYKLALKYGITNHTNLLAIDTGEGILFKKYEAAK